MRKKKKVNAKDVVLPHSQAKLDLYSRYLVHYLRILSLTPFVDKINLYDVFCGKGIYKDGKEGSPIITHKCIQQINEFILSSGKELKKITVTVNDFDKKKITNVQSILTESKPQNCVYNFHSMDANEMLDKIAVELNGYGSRERNLLFIDPYGYSPIKKEKIFNLLKNDRSEIILFLPVSQMYRFYEVAISDEDKACYEDLRTFIYSFLPSNLTQNQNGFESIFHFINAIKLALNFNNQFYTCSHYIQRGGANYNALFFITANLLGLEKMIEAKWNLDPHNGEGFNQPSLQGNLFEEQSIQEDKTKNINFFKEVILEYLNQKPTINNCELYELGLKNEFRPSQALEAINALHSSKRIEYTYGEGNPSKYINYSHHKKKEIKFVAKLK